MAPIDRGHRRRSSKAITDALAARTRPRRRPRRPSAQSGDKRASSPQPPPRQPRPRRSKRPARVRRKSRLRRPSSRRKPQKAAAVGKKSKKSRRCSRTARKAAERRKAAARKPKAGKGRRPVSRGLYTKSLAEVDESEGNPLISGRIPSWRLSSDARPQRQAGAGFLRLWPSQVTKQPMNSGLPPCREIGPARRPAAAGSN